MSNIFTLENVQDFSEKISIDDLYEKKRQYDLNKLALFNKILNRVHVRIKTTSRQKIDEHFCWFVVPEMIIGVPRYDQGACIAYIMDKLKENGFNVRYVHPNTLFISWLHWIPSYVRTELKKKTGIEINEFGEKIKEEGEEEEDPRNKIQLSFSSGGGGGGGSGSSVGSGNGSSSSKPFQWNQRSSSSSSSLYTMNENFTTSQHSSKPKKSYTPIQSYKPSGNLF